MPGDGGGGVGGGVELEVRGWAVGLLRGGLGVVVGHGGRGRWELWQVWWAWSGWIDRGWVKLGRR